MEPPLPPEHGEPGHDCIEYATQTLAALLAGLGHPNPACPHHGRSDRPVLFVVTGPFVDDVLQHKDPEVRRHMVRQPDRRSARWN